MQIHSFIDVLAAIISFSGSLLLIGTGFWVWLRTKLPGLPWIITCWIINSPMVSFLNSWSLETFFGPRTAANASSLLPQGMPSIRDFMPWHNLIASLANLTLTLLIVAQATLLVHQIKTTPHDKLPLFLGPVQTFSTAFGFLAVLLAMANHLSLLLLQWL